MRVGVVQFAPRFGDPVGNLARVTALLQGRQAGLWVLPELCTTGYQFRSRAEARRLAEPVGGPATRAILALATSHQAVVVAGFLERRGRRLHNSALVTSPAGVLGVYRKVHLFHREKAIFAPGSRFDVFPTPLGRLGVMICFDWRFPEAARALVLHGAEVVAHPSALVHTPGPDALVTRALENRIFIATADRTGTEARIAGERLTFRGESQVVAPSGRVLFRMGREAGARAVSIRPEEARDKRVTPFNHVLGDRRPSAYLP